VVALRRLRLDIEYDGTNFAGWQVQPGCRTVQGELDRALGTVVRQPVRVVGSGRTDAGVHARGQVAHADLPEDAPSLARLRAGVQALVGPEIAVRDLAWAPDSFHARFSARSRTYRYRMTLRPRALDRALVWLVRHQVDVAAMARATPYLVGRYQATTWCAAHAADRHVYVGVTAARLWDEDDLVIFEIAADRFVTHMVRIIVGTLVDVGRQRRSPDSIAELIRAQDRRLAGPTAPACGLCLEHVDYGDTVQRFGPG